MHSLTASRSVRHYIRGSGDETRLVFSFADSGVLLPDLNSRLLEGRWRILIEGLKCVEIRDAFDVGHDVIFDGLVVRE